MTRMAVEAGLFPIGVIPPRIGTRLVTGNAKRLRVGLEHRRLLRRMVRIVATRAIERGIVMKARRLKAVETVRVQTIMTAETAGKRLFRQHLRVAKQIVSGKIVRKRKHQELSFARSTKAAPYHHSSLEV